MFCKESEMLELSLKNQAAYWLGFINTPMMIDNKEYPWMI
jgi:hypothetical protein